MENLIHIGSRTHVPASQILMIKADINYSYVYLLNGKCLYSSTTLAKIQKRLERVGGFSRVHSSYLINEKLLQYSSAGEYKAAENLTFLVSRRKAKRRLMKPLLNLINQ